MPRPRKPTVLLEASGAYEKNPSRRRVAEPKLPEGELIRPSVVDLDGRAAELWNEYSELCFNMGTAGRGDELELATWCLLEAEFESDPRKMVAAKIAQKRTYAERFGIAGAGSRAKLATTNAKENADPAEGYFKSEARPSSELRN